MVGWRLSDCKLVVLVFKTDFTTNFCGPYYSDGRIQSSVEDPIRQPVNRLDAACRRHDIAYARAKGKTELLTLADETFFDEVVNLPEHPIRGPLYGALVYYGNKLFRSKNKMLRRETEEDFYDRMRSQAGTNAHPQTPYKVIDNSLVYAPNKTQGGSLPGSGGSQGRAGAVYNPPVMREQVKTKTALPKVNMQAYDNIPITNAKQRKGTKENHDIIGMLYRRPFIKHKRNRVYIM